MSLNETFCARSCRRVGMSTGRSPTSNERSATRAARFADRTDAKVAMARINVPPAVASAEMVTQSTTREPTGFGLHGQASSHRGGVLRLDRRGLAAPLEALGLHLDVPACSCAGEPADDRRKHAGLAKAQCQDHAIGINSQRVA